MRPVPAPHTDRSGPSFHPGRIKEPTRVASALPFEQAGYADVARSPRFPLPTDGGGDRRGDDLLRFAFLTRLVSHQA